MRKHRGAAFAVAALTAISAPVAVAAEKPVTVLAKPGGSLTQRAKDAEVCREVAQKAPEVDLPQLGDASRASAAGYAPDVPSAIGASIGFLIVAMIDVSRARGRAQAVCLGSLGYVAVPLSPDEARAYMAAMAPAAREAWEREFLAGDLTARVAQASPRDVPLLPGYRVEPGAQGGVKLDLASLAATGTSLAVDSVAITGRLSRSRTAELVQPFRSTAEGATKVSAEQGVIFHQVDYRPQRSALLRDQGATWCGPLSEETQGSRSTQVYCLTPHAGGYDVFRPTGYAWLAGPYRDGIVLPRLTQPVVLQERAADDLGGFDLQIKVAEISGQRFVLEGYAVRADRKVQLWRRGFKLGADGSAALPLWTRRAVFTQPTPKTLAVRLEDQADGAGWREGDP